jgi:hypothetical protein
MLKASKARMADVHGTTARQSASCHGSFPQDNDPHDLTLVISPTG